MCKQQQICVKKKNVTSTTNSAPAVAAAVGSAAIDVKC